ncbi:Peptide chain release factor subunit 1 [uncultured archaeon]|nr:Peptide chain release factor subunit 1 [uncultured archaeon]
MSETELMYELKKQLRKLSEYRGSGTEMVSVYIPAGYPIHETANRLREEVNQAGNIKSKTTRNNVTDALERIIAELKKYKQTPPNGMVLFAGNISDNPSKTVMELFALEPPQPLNISVYRCDSHFFLEPLQRIMDTTDSYGLVVMDGRDATVALLKGTQTIVVKKLHSMAHAKVNKGGQSQRRYQRLVEEGIEYYYKRVGAAMDDGFLGRGVKGVIIGGPGPAKDNFYKMAPYNYQHKVLGVVDTGYTDEYGLREVISKSDSLIHEQESVREGALVERFIKAVIQDGLAAYGENEVRKAIESKQADTVLLSEGLKYKKVRWKCGNCGHEESKTVEGEPEETMVCTQCRGKMTIDEDEPLIEELTDLAKERGIKVEIISENTAAGAQFLQGFTGIGAFLRYK